jgi:mannose-6-phosphate isomerase-like protein (cupin superfamily)
MKIAIILGFLLISITGNSQMIIDTKGISAPEEYTNINVQKIAGDSLVSTFIIHIKENVPMHKHVSHSENVLILEGEGTMVVGEITKEVKVGDLIFIPANTFHEVIVTSEKPLKVISIQAPEFDGTDRIPYVKN